MLIEQSSYDFLPSISFFQKNVSGDDFFIFLYKKNARIYLTSAITSISINASFGSLETSTQERAGLCSAKYVP